ncbi:MAG: hypothetical protein Q9222_006595 [Ikaeria aurantiellina]
MPERTVSHRPQTLRQAKKAYQKAGGSPRLSAVEQRRLERSAELQERAARIKAHNLRAKENKRKREERLEKAKEARKRMGQPEPAKNYIGPSQLSLGSFMGIRKGIKHEKSCPPPEVTKDTKPIKATEVGSIYPGSLKAESPVKSESIVLKPDPSPTRPLSKLLLPCSPLTPTTAGTLKKKSVPSTSLMLPPKLPIKRPVSNSKPKPTVRSSKSESNNPFGMDWETFFESNTQVEREISDHGAKPPIPLTDQGSAVRNASCPPPNIQIDLFAGISTQDLQYSPSSSPLEVGNNADTDAEFACGIADEDFGNLLQDADFAIARTPLSV